MVCPTQRHLRLHLESQRWAEPDHVEAQPGRDVHYGFSLSPPAVDPPVHIETSIILPGWAVPEVFNGRTFRVVYLQDTRRALKNEAIDIEILSCGDAGFHDSVDARPFGMWPGIPIGPALGSFGALGLRYKKDDEVSTRPDNEMS